MLGGFKKFAGLFLAGTLVLEGAAPAAVMAEEIPKETRVIEVNLLTERNTNFEGADGKGVPHWWYGSSAQISISSNCAEGNYSMYVVPQGVGSYIGGASNLIDKLVDGATYEYSYQAKLAGEEGTTGKVALVVNQVYDEDYQDTELILAETDETYTFSTEEWTTVTGTFTPKAASGKEFKSLHLVFSAIDSQTPFYVDDFKVQQIGAKQKEIQKDLKDLKKQFTEDFQGKAGVAIPSSALSDTARMELVTKHFNSVTAENEMKPDSFLGSELTISANGFPVLTFKSADTMMDEIKKHNENHPDSPIRVRGHVLVWHSQTPEWFFHEDYDVNKPYVNKTDMAKRMENYICQVMEHFDGADSPYKGMIYAWDVVNEAINDSDGGLRTDTDTISSNWYKVYQDASFITDAFVYANQYAPAEVKLFYNDYNDTTKNKYQGICALIDQIQATPGARIDGMGMQAHYDMSAPSMGQFSEAANAYAEALGEGGEIQLTELDLKSSNDYDGTNQDSEYQKQAYRYKELYETICSLKQEGVNFTGITFWGTHDGASWLQSSNSVGGASDGTRKQCPLLFDDDYQAKPAYYAFVDPSQLKPNIQSIVAVNTEEFANAAAAYSFQAGEANVSFTPIWNAKGLQVKVTVADETVDESDQVTVYVDSADAREDASATIAIKTVTRAEAEAITGGYETVITLPVSDMAVMKCVGFDVKVVNGAETASFNDITQNQDNSSAYYSKLVLKPFMEIHQGSVTVDGKEDAIWSQVSEIPLSISLSAKASAKAKLLWDAENLYVLVKVVDATLDKSASAAHEQDSVEVFIDENNHKSDSYEEDDKQYRVNFDNEASFNGTNCKAEYLTSSTALTEDGYMLEAAFKWTDITPEQLAKIGIELQINDAEGGARIGTASWYDESGKGWSAPSVFGTAVLSEEPKAAEPVNPSVPNPGTGGDSQKEEKEYFAAFSVKSVKLQKGKSSTALAKDIQIDAQDAVISWTSSNTKVVRVSATGKIKGIKNGKAVITAKTKMGKEASITVQVVKNKVKTTKLVVKNKDTDAVIKSGTKLTLAKKETVKLTASAVPMTTQDKVTYSSNNKKVVRVSKSGVITAKKKGSAVISIQSGKKKVKIKITVK